MSKVTEKLAKYISERDVNLAEMSKRTGIAYMDIYHSIGAGRRNRSLRDYELLMICKYLNICPMDLLVETKNC